MAYFKARVGGSALPTNTELLVNATNTTGGTYTTTRDYAFIVCAGSSSQNLNATDLFTSFSCDGGSVMINDTKNGSFNNSKSFGRLTVFKDVPSGSTITYTYGTNNSNTYIIYGIY